MQSAALRAGREAGPSFEKGARPLRGQSLGVAVDSSHTTDGKRPVWLGRPPRFLEGGDGE